MKWAQCDWTQSRELRTAHLSVLTTGHNCDTQYNTEQFWYLLPCPPSTGSHNHHKSYAVRLLCKRVKSVFLLYMHHNKCLHVSQVSHLAYLRQYTISFTVEGRLSHALCRFCTPKLGVHSQTFSISANTLLTLSILHAPTQKPRRQSSTDTHIHKILLQHNSDCKSFSTVIDTTKNNSIEWIITTILFLRLHNNTQNTMMWCKNKNIQLKATQSVNKIYKSHWHDVSIGSLHESVFFTF